MHTKLRQLATSAIACLIASCATSCGSAEDNADNAQPTVATPATQVADSLSANQVAAKNDWRSMTSAARPLEGGASSQRALIDTVLDAFASRDTATLHSLLIDRSEFVDIVYPELGEHYAAARDTRQETKDFLWDNQYLNARKGLFKALREVGGRKLSYVNVRFADGDKQFKTYRLHEGTELTVTEESGKEATLLALGSIIERDGRFKLLSYRDID